MAKTILSIEWLRGYDRRAAFVRGIPKHRSLAWRGERMAYACGDLPPRYPMPATFGQVFITSRNVYRANPQGWDSETYL